MDIRLFINLCLLTVALAFRRQHYHVQHPKVNSKHSNCAPGWTSYRDSCYFYEHHMLTFDKAEVRCLERDSLMFVAETMDEWKEVMKNSPSNYYTWVGLKQRIDEHEPKWVSGSGIGAAHLDWLNPTYKGWNENAKCVARFNSAATTYSHFFFCGSQFYSVCERNSTLLHNIWDEGDRGF